MRRPGVEVLHLIQKKISSLSLAHGVIKRFSQDVFLEPICKPQDGFLQFEQFGQFIKLDVEDMVGRDTIIEKRLDHLEDERAFPHLARSAQNGDLGQPVLEPTHGNRERPAPDGRQGLLRLAAPPRIEAAQVVLKSLPEYW